MRDVAMFGLSIVTNIFAVVACLAFVLWFEFAVFLARFFGDE